jgi:hypothetical protein
MNPHNTEQAARGLLMYHLAMRGYTVQFTDSRFPREDLLCVSPLKEKHFGIEVKGQRTTNFWRFNEPKVNPGRFYAFVYVPKSDKPRICIMSSKVVQKLWKEYKDNALNRNEISSFKRKPSAFQWGLNWKTPFEYEDNYKILPK